MTRWHTRLIERYTTYRVDMMKDLGALPLVLRIRMILIWQEKYWDLYENCDHLLPEVSALSYLEHDPHSKRILDASDWKNLIFLTKI